MGTDALVLWPVALYRGAEFLGVSCAEKRGGRGDVSTIVEGPG